MRNLFILIFLTSTTIVIGQNKDLKWQFNTGANAIIYRYPVDIPGNMFDFKKSNFALPLSYMSLSKHLFGGFSPELKFAANKVAEDPTIAPTKNLLVNGLLNLKYSLANGYIFSTKSFIEPYFKGGIGMTYLDVIDNDKFLTTFSYGGGIAIWPTKNRNIGIQFQQLYHMVPMFQFNQRDYFEHSITLAYKFGMKDMDKDGIADKDDRCPDVAGIKALAGCPDKDGDGIADKDDRCPEDAGPKELEGCPDKDGDGVADIDDTCPDVKGLAIYKGCPDTDGDSIPDNIDSCPTVKGVKQFYGCPDTDGDGVEDKYDKCPNVKGLAKFEGCPDKDGDGVPDAIDKCPDVPGPASNNGCPDETKRKEIEESIAFNAKSIFFSSDKYAILSKSYPMLDAIVEIMKTNSQEIFVVEGHTDITGDEKHNLELSRNRAKAVKNYLISKGIDPSRLEADGFGIKYPIADNNTPAGRAKNRRVDITIKR